MKTNVPIELSDAQRDHLANLIDRKKTKRKASRKEIIEICQRHIGGLAESPFSMDAADPPDFEDARGNPLSAINWDDPLTPCMARPNDPGYVRGWNLAARDSQ